MGTERLTHLLDSQRRTFCAGSFPSSVPKQTQTSGTSLISLTQGKFAVVDSADFERLNQYKWYAQKHRNTWYAYRNQRKDNGKYTLIAMHREILRPLTGMETDHKDGNGLNNRRVNLRTATISQNQHNQRPQKKGISKYKGVSWYRNSHKWRAKIEINGRTISLGYFFCEIEAAKTYDTVARKYFGEFARTNF